jgi:hypothetical protein
MEFSTEGSFSSHTYWDTGPRIIRSHPKDRHPRPTVGVEPGMQGPSDLCASALTTSPRVRILTNVETSLLPVMNCKILAYARRSRSGPLSREGYLLCHACCDSGTPFLRSDPINPINLSIQSPLTTRKGMRRTFSNWMKKSWVIFCSLQLWVKVRLKILHINALTDCL